MTAEYTSRTCCCCIPVRAGIILLAPVTLLLSCGLAGAIIFHLWSSGSRLPTSTQVIGGFYISLMLLLAIASFLGLVGSARKVIKLVKVYFYALLAAWILGIGLGTAYVANTFLERHEIIGMCLARQERLWNGNEPLIKLGQDACKFKFKLWAGLFISLWLLFHSIFLYFVVVASRAARILEEDEAAVRNTYAYPGGGAARTMTELSNSSTLPVIQPPRGHRKKRSSATASTLNDGEKTPKLRPQLNLTGGPPGASSGRDRERTTPPSATNAPPTPGGNGAPSTPWQARFSQPTPRSPRMSTGEGAAWGSAAGPGTRPHALSHSSTWSGYVTASDETSTAASASVSGHQRHRSDETGKASSKAHSIIEAARAHTPAPSSKWDDSP